MADREQDEVDGEVIVNPGTKPARIPGGQGGRGFLTPVRTSERARELVAKRWAGVSRAARLGISDAGGQLPGLDKRKPLKVVRYLAEQHTLNAADPSARNSVASLNAVMRLAYPEPQRNPDGSSSVTPSDAGAIAKLVAMLEAAEAADPEFARRVAELVAARDGS